MINTLLLAFMTIVATFESVLYVRPGCRACTRAKKKYSELMVECPTTMEIRSVSPSDPEVNHVPTIVMVTKHAAFEFTGADCVKKMENWISKHQ